MELLSAIYQHAAQAGNWISQTASPHLNAASQAMSNLNITYLQPAWSQASAFAATPQGMAVIAVVAITTLALIALRVYTNHQTASNSETAEAELKATAQTEAEAALAALDTQLEAEATAQTEAEAALAALDTQLEAEAAAEEEAPGLETTNQPKAQPEAAAEEEAPGLETTNQPKAQPEAAAEAQPKAKATPPKTPPRVRALAAEASCVLSPAQAAESVIQRLPKKKNGKGTPMSVQKLTKLFIEKELSVYKAWCKENKQAESARTLRAISRGTDWREIHKVGLAK